MEEIVRKIIPFLPFHSFGYSNTKLLITYRLPFDKNANSDEKFFKRKIIKWRFFIKKTVTVMLVTWCCWWIKVRDNFWMLVTKFLSWWHLLNVGARRWCKEIVDVVDQKGQNRHQHDVHHLNVVTNIFRRQHPSSTWMKPKETHEIEKMKWKTWRRQKSRTATWNRQRLGFGHMICPLNYV